MLTDNKNNLFFKSLWIVAIFIAIIMLLMFNYKDIKTLTIWGTNFLDCIADGNVSKYFEFSILNIHHLSHVYANGININIWIQGIWNLPIWVAQRYFNVEIIKSSICLLWSKVFLIGCLGVTLYYAKKIVNYLVADKKLAKWATFLSFSYMFTYIGIFYAGQNDIMTCMVSTVALYYLIINTKKGNYIFYALSGLAITFKYFFFVPYFIIVLFTEKKISKILLKIFIGILPCIVYNLICYNWPMYVVEITHQETTEYMIGQMIGGSFKMIRNYQLSIMILSMVVLAFMAYIHKCDDNKERGKYIIYYVTISYILMFLFSSVQFYRMILLMPFMFILFTFKPEKFRLNIIIDTLVCAAYFIAIASTSSAFFSAKGSMDVSILNHFFNIIPNDISAKSLVTGLFGTNLKIVGQICASVVFTGYMVLIIINHPKFNKKFDVDGMQIEKSIVWIRTLLLVPIIVYMLYHFFI